LGRIRKKIRKDESPYNSIKKTVTIIDDSLGSSDNRLNTKETFHFSDKTDNSNLNTTLTKQHTENPIQNKVNYLSQFAKNKLSENLSSLSSRSTKKLRAKRKLSIRKSFIPNPNNFNFVTSPSKASFC